MPPTQLPPAFSSSFRSSATTPNLVSVSECVVLALGRGEAGNHRDGESWGHSIQTIQKKEKDTRKQRRWHQRCFEMFQQTNRLSVIFILQLYHRCPQWQCEMRPTLSPLSLSIVNLQGHIVDCPGQTSNHQYAVTFLHLITSTFIPGKICLPESAAPG